MQARDRQNVENRRVTIRPRFRKSKSVDREHATKRAHGAATESSMDGAFRPTRAIAAEPMSGARRRRTYNGRQLDCARRPFIGENSPLVWFLFRSAAGGT